MQQLIQPLLDLLFSFRQIGDVPPDRSILVPRPVVEPAAGFPSRRSATNRARAADRAHRRSPATVDSDAKNGPVSASPCAQPVIEETSSGQALGVGFQPERQLGQFRPASLLRIAAIQAVNGNQPPANRPEPRTSEKSPGWGRYAAMLLSGSGKAAMRSVQARARRITGRRSATPPPDSGQAFDQEVPAAGRWIDDLQRQKPGRMWILGRAENGQFSGPAPHATRKAHEFMPAYRTTRWPLRPIPVRKKNCPGWISAGRPVAAKQTISCLPRCT